MSRLLFFSLLLPLGLFAQEEGEQFWSGLISYNANVNNTLRITPAGTYSNDHVTGYYLDSRINRGKFISNNRAFFIGVLGSVNYYESDFIKVNGQNRYNVTYQVGGQIGLSKYYFLLPRFYATANHDFSYTYSWNETNESYSSKITTHGIAYRFAPGLYYRIRSRWGLQLNLSLLNISVNRSLSKNTTTQSESQRLSLGLFSGTSLGNLTFGVVYFPFQSQRKKAK